MKNTFYLLLLLCAVHAPLSAQNKPASKSSGATDAQAGKDLLNPGDLEVTVVSKDGGEMHGYLKRAVLFYEYDSTLHKFVPKRGSATAKIITKTAEEKNLVSSEGLFNLDQLTDVQYVISGKEIEKLSLVLYFPDNVVGYVEIPYNTVDFVENHGFLTSDKIAQITAGIEEAGNQAKARSDAASKKLGEFFAKKREEQARQDEDYYLKQKAQELESGKGDRKKLVERFPPEKGWGKEKYDSIGKEYIATQGQGFVDAEEDYFYKHFDDWKKGVEETSQETLSKGDKLLDQCPPKAGWGQSRYDEIKKKMSGGGELTADEIAFAEGYKDWTDARGARKSRYDSLLAKFPPDSWSEDRYLELKKTKESGKTLSGQEQEFVENYTDWRTAPKWLAENEEKKTEPAAETGK